jgi:hypothetical protein
MRDVRHHQPRRRATFGANQIKQGGKPSGDCGVLRCPFRNIPQFDLSLPLKSAFNQGTRIASYLSVDQADGQPRVGSSSIQSESSKRLSRIEGCMNI